MDMEMPFFGGGLLPICYPHNIQSDHFKGNSDLVTPCLKPFHNFRLLLIKTPKPWWRLQGPVYSGFYWICTSFHLALSFTHSVLVTLAFYLMVSATKSLPSQNICIIASSFRISLALHMSIYSSFFMSQQKHHFLMWFPNSPNLLSVPVL